MSLDPAETIAKALSSKAPAKGARRHKKARKAKKPRVPKLHRPKKESTKTIIARLYKTWSAIVHARSNNRCEVCGAEGKNDAHHVQPRQICSGLRFDPRNGVCLCPSHHKYGHQSAHKGMLWFVDWFKNHRPDDYDFVMSWLDHEIDCKNRGVLYAIEENLHDKYEDAISPIPRYKVVGYDRKGNRFESVVKAMNNRAAEYIFWEYWPVGEEGYEKLKGIHKTEQVEIPRWSEDDVECMKKDLVGRGLMDEDGNAIHRQQTPKISDAAKIAVVQTFADDLNRGMTQPGLSLRRTASLQGSRAP